MASANAAEEKSPGTSKSRGASWCTGESRTLARPSASVARSSGTPSCSSIRSVWSRLSSGSRTDTVTAPHRPASRMALFTCADACGLS